MKNLFPQGRRALGLLLAGACLAQIGNVSAAPMNVTATVAPYCELGTLSDVAFGTLFPGGPDAAGNGAIEWRCTIGTDAEIAIDDGALSTRNMVGGVVTGTAQLPYELFKEAGWTNVWGDTGTDVVSVTGAGLAAFSSEVVYGRVLGADYLNAERGPYADIVDVTITII